MRNDEELRLVYRAGKLVGMALQFEDGELESILETGSFRCKDAIRATIDFRNLLLGKNKSNANEIDDAGRGKARAGRRKNSLNTVTRMRIKKPAG